MARSYEIFCSYSEKDTAFAHQLADILIKNGYSVFPQQFKLIHGEDYEWQGYLENSRLFFVLVSEASVNDLLVLEQILFAQQHFARIIPVIINKCRLPASLERIQPFDFAKISTSRFRGLLDFYFPPNVTLSALPEPQSKNIFKSIIESINPFKKPKSKSAVEDYEYIDKLDRMMESSPADSSISRSPAPSPSFPGKPAAKPVDSSSKGKVLYDIPDSMTVNVQQRCVVRIGKSEAIVKDDDTFSTAVKIESVPISKVMQVDLLDISEPPHFNIRKISSDEQLVEKGSFSEWIFLVTPLGSGKFSLILKVSIIKIVDGKERRKELVFEKPVDITAGASPESSPAGIPVVNTGSGKSTTASETTLKDLGDEATVKEMDPPKAFISYAHKDKIYFDIFLEYLQSQSGWNFWTDRNIEIGSGWYEAIQQSVKNADVALLLISAHFLSSEFIKEHEFSRFSELKAQKPGFRFLPILLRDVDFTRWEDLASMQLFVAYGDEYGVPDKSGEIIPFAKLCRFDNNGRLIPNDNLDTYFKNLVSKAEKDWLQSHDNGLKKI